MFDQKTAQAFWAGPPAKYVIEDYEENREKKPPEPHGQENLSLCKSLK
jgi:hypothetical protein